MCTDYTPKQLALLQKQFSHMGFRPGRWEPGNDSRFNFEEHFDQMTLSVDTIDPEKDLEAWAVLELDRYMRMGQRVMPGAELHDGLLPFLRTHYAAAKALETGT